MAQANLTVEAVIRPDTVATGTYAFIASRDQDGTAGPWWLNIHNGKAEFGVWGGASNAIIAGSTTLVAGTTYHIAGTYDGTTVKVYVNGVLDGSLAGPGAIRTNNQAMRIGNWPAANLPFDGKLAALHIFPSALSATRLTAHVTAAAPPVSPTGTISAVLPALSAHLPEGMTNDSTVVRRRDCYDLASQRHH